MFNDPYALDYAIATDQLEVARRLVVVARLALVPRRRCAPPAELHDGLTQPASDVGPGAVRVRPRRHRLEVPGQALDVGEGRRLPLAGPHQYRHHPRLAADMALECPRRLKVPAVVRGDEVRTDQQQDEVRRFQVSVDLALPITAGVDLPVVPGADRPFALE